MFYPLQQSGLQKQASLHTLSLEALYGIIVVSFPCTSKPQRRNAKRSFSRYTYVDPITDDLRSKVGLRHSGLYVTTDASVTGGDTREMGTTGASQVTAV